MIQVSSLNISSLPSSTKDENAQLFKELEKLVEKEYEEKVPNTIKTAKQLEELLLVTKMKIDRKRN